jgi:hypothetical protein
MDRKKIIVRIDGKDVDFDDLPALIPVPVAGQILGLMRATAYRYAATGDLPVQRFGGRRVYVVKARLRPLLLTDGNEAAA